MNWLKFITFIYIIIKTSYVLLTINYFIRFVWIKVYQYHETFETMILFRKHIISVFDWSKKVYTNNESHFVNYDVIYLMKQHEVSHFIDSINHFESTDFLKWMMQKLLLMINKKCIEWQSTNSWSLMIRDHVLIMNIKIIKIYDYFAAQIMLEFELIHVYFNTKFLIFSDLKQTEQIMSFY